jgi:hypothetical protein
MPSGAGQLSSGCGGQAAAQVPSPSGRRSDRSLPCPRPRSRRGDVRPTGRADVQRPGVRCPGVRCIQVSGRTGLRCPRRCRRAVRAALDLEWLGVAGRPRVGRSGSTCRRGPRPAWSPAGIGPDGKGWCGVGRAGSQEGDRSPGPAAWPASRLGRGLAAGPTRALVQGGVPAGWWGSWDGAGAHRPPQCVLGRSPAWCRPWAWTRRW